MHFRTLYVPPSRRLRQPNKSNEDLHSEPTINGHPEESQKFNADEARNKLLKALNLEVDKESKEVGKTRSETCEIPQREEKSELPAAKKTTEEIKKAEKLVEPKKVEPSVNIEKTEVKKPQVPEVKKVEEKISEPKKVEKIEPKMVDAAKEEPKIVKNEAKAPEPKKEEPKIVQSEPKQKPKDVKGTENGKISQVATIPKEKSIPGSILSTLEVGEVCEIATDFEGENNPTKFFGTLCSDPLLETLGNGMDECFSNKTPLTKIETGDFVAVNGDAPQRCIISGKAGDKSYKVFDIDIAMPNETPQERIFALSAKMASVPSLCLICKAQGNVDKNLQKLIEGLVEKQSGSIKMKITKKHEHFVECILLDENNKQIIPYLLTPWVNFNPEICQILTGKSGYFLQDLPNEPLKIGDQLMFLCFGPNKSHTLVTMNQKDATFEEAIMNIMAVEAPKEKSIEAKNLKANQVVACKWSEDDSFYRAIIKEVKDDKAKVRFIDYGNLSLEPLDRIKNLPEAALAIPILGKLVALHGVPASSCSDIRIKNRYNFESFSKYKFSIHFSFSG